MGQAILTQAETPPLFRDELEAARQGDAAALSRLADRFYPTVQRIVHRKLAVDLRSSKPWLAARFSTGDVVQEVFQSVLHDLHAFAGTNEEAFIGYLAMVIRNRIIDAVRFHEADCRDGRRVTRSEVAMDIAGPEGDPATEIATGELVERLHAALNQFDTRTQLLVRARMEGQATFGDLANQLGFETESGARKAFYAAQARLTLLLKED